MGMTKTTKAQNPTTGTVHYAKADGAHLVQIHGATAGQRTSLVETDAEVTCKTCLKLAPAPVAAKPAAAPTTFGRQGWKIGELREAAKLNGIKPGRKTGDELLALIIEVAPQYA